MLKETFHRLRECHLLNIFPEGARSPDGQIHAFQRGVALNLNTHRMSCLYEAFPPAEARRIIEKIEVIHTPENGSWLNREPACGCECEMSVLEKQYLGERIGDEATLRKQTSIGNANRKNRSKKIDWQFATPNARIKLRRLYPQIPMERTTIS